MISFLIRIVINAVALLIISNVSTDIQVKGFVAALTTALVLGIANAVVKPILQFIAGGMTCVLSCLTLGLWSLILSWLINAFLFWGAGQLNIGFVVSSFSAALWGALALSIVNALATVFTSRDKDER